MLKNILVFVFFALYFIFRASGAGAQEVSLSLTPSTNEVVAKPGSTGSLSFILKNLADPTTIILKVVNAEQQDNLGVISPGKALEGPIRFWLDDEKLRLDEPFFLKSDEVKNLSLSIDVAKQTVLKDYSFVLLAESQPPPVNEGVSAIRIKSSLGSNIFISVSESPLVKVEPKIVLFELVRRFKLSLGNWKITLVDTFGTIPAVLTIENRGNYRIYPRGKLELRGGLWNKKIYEINQHLVPAQSQRLTSFILSGFFLGLYDVTTTINFGPGTPTLYGSVQFFAFPFKLFFLGTIVIAGVFFYLRRKSLS